MAMTSRRTMLLRSLRSIIGRGRARVLPQEFKEVVRQAAAAAGPSQAPKDPRATVVHHLRGSRKQQPLVFVRAVIRLSREQRGQKTLHLACRKDEVAAEIRDILVGDFFHPTAALVLGMKAVTCLSHFQPQLNPSIEDSIVAWATQEVMTWAPSQEDPEDQHLAHWMQSGQAGVRRKAVSLSSALLHFALHLPSFKNDAEPLLGSLVAQLAVCLADPERDIWRRVREAVSWLHRLLLRQRGLSGKGAPLLWHLGRGHPWRSRCYDLIRVGEVLGPHLTPAQEATYLRTSWEQVRCLDQEWVRVGGLFLLYSLLGQAYTIIEAEEEEEGFKAHVAETIYRLWQGEDIPEELHHI
uniref:Uncharacterized protein n=1 Tax=Sphaerodactylus townsendi TaxID=933632 RepID=A0ACB8E6H8_9SAUR